jgi:putative endonuclease
MIACYIIHSKQIDKYYIGVTQEDIDSRILKHNTEAYGKKYTSQANDWVLFHYIVCETYSQAINIERHIKRMKSKKYIEDLKKYPEMSAKMLVKYRNT